MNLHPEFLQEMKFVNFTLDQVPNYPHGKYLRSIATMQNIVVPFSANRERALKVISKTKRSFFVSKQQKFGFFLVMQAK